jgi:hypothetical protein
MEVLAIKCYTLKCGENSYKTTLWTIFKETIIIVNSLFERLFYSKKPPYIIKEFILRHKLRMLKENGYIKEKKMHDEILLIF